VRVVLQLVSQAQVQVAGQTVGKIGPGFFVLLGVAKGDSEEDLDFIVRKITAMRIFPDSEGKMNLSLEQAAGKVLMVSQFTLLANTQKGNRPSFVEAAPAELAESMYNQAIDRLRASGVEVQTGKFGATMSISLVNEGPVTILMDSKSR